MSQRVTALFARLMRGHVQRIGNLSNPGQHLKDTIVARSKLGAVSFGDQELPTWMELEKNPIADVESPF